MSKKPSKERKHQHNRPMHKISKSMASHLDEKLAKELKKRAIGIKKGDTIKIMRGEYKGKEGKITAIDKKHWKIYIEKITKKKSNGQDWQVPIDPSKVMIIELERTDRRRLAKKKEVKK